MNWTRHASATLLGFLFHGTGAAWALENERHASRAIAQGISEERCRPGERGNRTWIAMTAGHRLDWEESERVGHPDVRVRLLEVDFDDEPMNVFDERGPLHYGQASDDRFVGSDGNSVHIKKIKHGWIAYRHFHEYIVSYQNSGACTERMDIDNAVLDFLGALLIGAQSRHSIAE